MTVRSLFSFICLGLEQPPDLPPVFIGPGIDHLQVQGLPAHQPRLVVACRFAMPQLSIGGGSGPVERRAALQLFTPSGKQHFAPPFDNSAPTHVVDGEAEGVGLLVFQMVNLRIEELGRYEFVVSVEEEEAARLRMKVIQAKPVLHQASLGAISKN